MTTLTERAVSDMQMRVPLSKEERKSLKARQRANLSGAAGLHDFADDVAGVLDVNEAEKGFFDKVRLAQKFGGTIHQDCTAPMSGGVRLSSFLFSFFFVLD